MTPVTTVTCLPHNLPRQLEAVQRPRLPGHRRCRRAAAVLHGTGPIAGHHQPLAHLLNEAAQGGVIAKYRRTG